MCHLEPWHFTAAVVVSETRKYGLFLRDAALMGSELGSRALRVAVKNKETNAMIVRTLDTVLCAGQLAQA